MNPGSPLPETGQDLREQRLLAVIKRLPSGVDYTFLRIILDTLPPGLETALLVTADPKDEILGAFTGRTYGVVDRLLRRRAAASGQLPERERETEETQVTAARHSLVQLLLAEAHAKRKAPGDCWIETRLVDPERPGRPSGPVPFSGSGVVVEVWTLGRDGRRHRLSIDGITAGPPPWGDKRIPWVDPVALDKRYMRLLGKYCRSLFRLRVGHEWRTRRAPSGWPVLTRRVIPQLYDYLLPFYPVRRYTAGRARPSSGKYPTALLRDIRDLLAAERPDLAEALTPEQVAAVLQRHLTSAPQDRPMGEAMFRVYPKRASAKDNTRPRS